MIDDRVVVVALPARETKTVNKPKPSHEILDIFPGVLELAELLKLHPKHLEKDKIKRGDELLIIFEDLSYKNTFKGLRDAKIQAIKAVCRDIAEGGEVLQSATMGVSFSSSTGKMEQVTAPLGSSPSGNMIFSIGYRSKRAFHGWRNEAGQDISQEDTNAILYRLAALLATIITG